MPSRHVDANYRFIAASNELNARIAQRQQSLAMYITLVLGLLAALVAFRPEAGQRVPVEWLVLGFPVASLCLVFLNYKAERALTNLRHFLATLESLDNADGSLPGYNTDVRWAEGANRARRFHDYTGAMLVVAGNGVALGALMRIYPNQASLDAPVVWITAIVAIGCVVALLWTSSLSYRPAN
jgi:hypothetical protein